MVGQGKTIDQGTVFLLLCLHSTINCGLNISPDKPKTFEFLSSSSPGPNLSLAQAASWRSSQPLQALCVCDPAVSILGCLGRGEEAGLHFTGNAGS
jgi:hypothetical protein